MRERSAPDTRAQRDQARGGERTMPRWLTAAMLLATATDAWSPRDPLPFTPRHPRNTTTRHLHLLGWHLELQENHAIRSHYKECKFYTGRVLTEEQSSATVTECDGQLYGLLQVGSEQFVLQPTRPGSQHVLRRRDVLYSEDPVLFNLTGDIVTDFKHDLDEEDAVPHVGSRHDHTTERDYFKSYRPVTRPVSGGNGLWIEIAIVADHTMLKFHGRERVKHYILALMNIASAIINDPSLDPNITLVISKLFLYEDTVLKNESESRSLAAANRWNKRHLMRLPAGSTGWDASIWLTRASIGGPAGLASLGGICDNERSAALAKDEGLSSAFTVAHELGHLLGLDHDGAGNNGCDARGSVMAPTLVVTLQKFLWSSCSKRKLHEKIKNRHWWCLEERSQEDGVVLGGAKEISRFVFTVHEQCRNEFGDGYSACKTTNLESQCWRLWCSHKERPNFCKSKSGPPLEGTPCGKNKWCVDRRCQVMPGQGEGKTKVEAPAHPQWEDWGPWSKCSADCGYGLRKRIRRCRYKGSYSESACEGAVSQMAACWSGVACAAKRDVRYNICMDQYKSFIPYIHQDESKQCEAWCVNYNGGEASAFGALPDGSPCSYDRPFDVCYQGACVKGQCNATDPHCNWCPDGYCNNNTYSYSRPLGESWTRLAMVPHDAHKLSVHIYTPVPLAIVLRERRKDHHTIELRRHNIRRIELNQNQNNYFKYDRNAPQNLQIIEVDRNVIDINEERYGWVGAAVAAGTLVQWNMTETDIYITANSRLQADLAIMAFPEQKVRKEDHEKVSVRLNYKTPTTRRRPMEYSDDEEGTTGPCSVSCGGGTRKVRRRCPAGRSCSPRVEYESCNTHSCNFKWVHREWEPCSATCGISGVQERQLVCVPADLNPTSGFELTSKSVSPHLCRAEEKPSEQQPCNVFPCPVYWQEMDWTPCSATCGKGFTYRPLTCPASHDQLCGPKPREERRSCRSTLRCPRMPRNCTGDDDISYCGDFPHDVLQRSCALRDFRRYCCNVCKNIRNSVRRSLYAG